MNEIKLFTRFFLRTKYKKVQCLPFTKSFTLQVPQCNSQNWSSAVILLLLYYVYYHGIYIHIRVTYTFSRSHPNPRRTYETVAGKRMGRKKEKKRKPFKEIFPSDMVYLEGPSTSIIIKYTWHRNSMGRSGNSSVVGEVYSERVFR